METGYLDAVYGLGRLIAGRGPGPAAWEAPQLLGWSNLLATAVWPALDAETRAHHAAALEGFAVAHALNTERNAELLAQLTRVVTRLNAAGIEPVVLKGSAHLATGLWPTPGSRLVSDIDLLVDKGAIGTAFSALEELAGTGPQDPGHPEIIAINKHLLPLHGAGGAAEVELHHSIFQARAARLAPTEDLVARARPLALGTARARILSPTDRVLTAMMHGLAGSGSYLMPTLHMRDMLDIHFLEAAHGTEIDWDGIAAQLTRNGWAAALAITNACLERFTGMPPPFAPPGPLARLDAARWVRQMERNNPVVGTAGRLANHLGYTLRSLRAGGEPRRRVLGNLGRADAYGRLLRRYLLGQRT
ncbi:MAG: nucleotidyltransferase family protein [Paracoccaceae bacterium]